MNEREEWLACALSEAYFVQTYCQIYDAGKREWVPFTLWPAQKTALKALAEQKLVIALKARQLGLTWLALAHLLHQMLFKPIATVLIFSKRDDEAVYLLGSERLRGMYARLPKWMQARATINNSAHEFALSNGSIARAFPTTAGDSYTATHAFVDEADLVPNLGNLMNAVKPTIDGGGQMVLLSRADNSKPDSEFKRIYKGAKQSRNGWSPLFLPWFARPERDAAWYERMRADIFERTGALDDLYQQYPASEAEALATRTLDTRLPAAWLTAVYKELPALRGGPAVPGLEIYRLPENLNTYVIGIDPAEGNPTSDTSTIEVLNKFTGEQVASYGAKVQPSTLAAHAMKISEFYHDAPVMVERNNHGHTVLLWFRDNARRVKRLMGWDGKEGWLSNTRGKNELYDRTADLIREGTVTLHSFATMTQLASLNGSTLRAPEGQPDDRADAFALACVALKGKPRKMVAAKVDFYGAAAG